MSRSPLTFTRAAPGNILVEELGVAPGLESVLPDSLPELVLEPLLSPLIEFNRSLSLPTRSKCLSKPMVRKSNKSTKDNQSPAKIFSAYNACAKELECNSSLIPDMTKLPQVNPNKQAFDFNKRCSND